MNYACIYLHFSIAAVEKKWLRSSTCDFVIQVHEFSICFVLKFKTLPHPKKSSADYGLFYCSDPFLIHCFSIFSLEIWLIVLYVEALVKYSLCTDDNCMF